MSDVLSQQEIDELLKALNSGEINVEEIKESDQEKKVYVYDFYRPNKFAKDQLRTMQIIFENFSRLMTSFLSGTLRSFCQIDVVSVEPQTYHEFINSLPDPVILSVVNFNPLKGSMIIEFSPEISFAIIDRLLGGQGKTMDKIRDFSEIELVLIERVIKQILPLLNESWSNVIKANFFLERIETNSQFAQIVAPNETIAIITISIIIGEVEGMINLCIPHVVIEPIINQLSTKYWFASKIVANSNGSNLELLSRKIEKTTLELKAVLGETVVTVKDFLDIQEGDVIRLDSKIGDNVQIFIEDKVKFYGEVGKKDKHLAVLINSIERGEEQEDE